MAIYLPGTADEQELALDDLTPREIVAELDKYVVGQAAAKRAVAIALRNRMRRQKLSPELANDIMPKNIIMIGPTGVGKTEIARRLAKLAVAVVGLGAINIYYWAWRAHEYVLTDQRVILNEGIFSKFSRSIAIDRIQDLTTFQGIWGRALRFGDIEVEAAGRESAEVLSTVPHPQQLRNAIFAQMEARRGR